LECSSLALKQKKKWTLTVTNHHTTAKSSRSLTDQVQLPAAQPAAEQAQASANISSLG
jgi:hypothetical protein